MASQCLRRLLTQTRVPISQSNLARNPISGRSELLNIWSKSSGHVSPAYAHRFSCIPNTQRKVLQKLNLSGRKLFSGSFLGLSAVAGVMYKQSTVVHAMDDYADSGKPSGFLKEDLDNLWSLIKRFQLPAVFLITILLGWRHPIALAINVTALLFCTKPSPSSIHIFIEEFGGDLERVKGSDGEVGTRFQFSPVKLRQRDLHHGPSLYISKLPHIVETFTQLFYVKKVDIQDFTFVCFGTVELRDMKLDVVGVLGGWWVLRSSSM